MATVTNQTEFKSAVSDQEPEIFVANDISLTSTTTIGYTVHLKGEAGASLFWSGPTAANPNMLIVTASGELSIESLILDAENRNGRFIQVTGGSFTMNNDTVLRNIRSTTANNAVRVGDMVSPVGGAFIMNGGLITGIDTSDAVFCGGGTIVMNNGAEISNNMASGITMTDTLQGGLRSSLTMTGRSRVTNNNHYRDAGGGVTALGSDVILGVNEGDAPVVTGNQTPYYGGGMLLSEGATLTMRYGAEISDNYAPQFAGGLLAQQTTVSMSGNAAIKNNRSDGVAGGVLLANATALLDDQAQIAGNTSGGRGAGVYMQERAVLQMKGYSSISGNNSDSDGAGVYLNQSTAFIGLDNSAPAISNNKSAGLGGGMYIVSSSTVNLMGQSEITGNSAVEGDGVYKRGVLNLSQSARIPDGLFFDDLQAVRYPDLQPSQSDQAVSPAMRIVDSEITCEPIIITEVVESGGVPQRESVVPSQAASSNLPQAYTDNVPIIVDALTTSALIQLEASGYVSPKNVPLVIAEKGSGYAQLSETDRAAWRLPQDFDLGYAIILNDTLDQVLVVLETYRIIYNNLHGAVNPNPSSYRTIDLPIILKDPERRPGHVFTGWYNAEGKRVTELPVGTTGEITLTAVWEKVFLVFDGNATCVSNMPEAINVEPGETIPIPSAIPRRSCYCFAGWNTSPSGRGTAYAPGGVISIPDKSITLYAQWRRLSNCCHNNHYRY